MLPRLESAPRMVRPQFQHPAAAAFGFFEVARLGEHDARVDERRHLGRDSDRGPTARFQRLRVPPLPGQVVAEVVIEVRRAGPRFDHLPQQPLGDFGAARALGGERPAFHPDHRGRPPVHRVHQRIADREVVVGARGRVRRRRAPRSPVAVPAVGAGERGGDRARLRGEHFGAFEKRQRFFQVPLAGQQPAKLEARGGPSFTAATRVPARRSRSCR